MLVQCQGMGLSDCYMAVPSSGLSDEALLQYWGELEAAGTLKFRWSNFKNPTAREILEYTKRPDIQRIYHSYNMVDVETGVIVADFALENFTGRAAQVHFSMRPGNDSRTSLLMADQVTDMLIETWPDMENTFDTYLDTLYGLTPVNNRVACIFVQKAGFRKMGILPRGSSYLGEICDTLITTKSRLN